jgi:hypothetical protein
MTSTTMNSVPFYKPGAILNSSPMSTTLYTDRSASRAARQAYVNGFQAC